MNIIYNMNDRNTNTIRPHDNMEMTIKHDQRRNVNAREILESLSELDLFERAGHPIFQYRRPQTKEYWEILGITERWLDKL